MNWSTLQSPAALPKDINVLHPMLWSLLCDYRKLSDENKLLKKELYGKRSEKQVVDDDAQTSIEGLFEQLSQAGELLDQNQTFVEVKVHKRRKKHPGRNAIPDNIETQIHTIGIPQEEKKCTGGCGNPRVKIGEQRRTIIERHPARYVKHVYVMDIYGCPTCKDTIVTADMPHVAPFPRMLAGLSLLLFVVTSKYQFHLPLYRIQRQIFHESGIWFTRSTMAGWIAQLCVPLRRIYLEMIAALKAGLCIFSDDSKIKRAAHSSFMWVYVNGERTIAIFDYRESKGSSAPREFLKGVAPGTYLMTDCCPSYNDAVSRYKLLQMACMMHVRREFVEAADVGSHKQFALRIVRYIGQLYRIERYATAKELTPEDRHAIRQQYSLPVVEKIKAQLLDPQIVMIPKCRIRQAINYTLNHWDKIIRFLDRGDLPIDNGVTERVIRDLAIGRKNWIQVMSDAGGKWTAILYSIIATCKLNNINPEEYLHDVLMLISIRDKDASVADLTPIEWLKKRNGGKLPTQKPLYPSKA